MIEVTSSELALIQESDDIRGNDIIKKVVLHCLMKYPDQTERILVKDQNINVGAHHSEWGLEIPEIFGLKSVRKYIVFIDIPEIDDEISTSDFVEVAVSKFDIFRSNFLDGKAPAYYYCTKYPSFTHSIALAERLSEIVPGITEFVPMRHLIGKEEMLENIREELSKVTDGVDNIELVDFSAQLVHVKDQLGRAVEYDSVLGYIDAELENIVNNTKGTPLLVNTTVDSRNAVMFGTLGVYAYFKYGLQSYNISSGRNRLKSEFRRLYFSDIDIALENVINNIKTLPDIVFSSTSDTSSSAFVGILKSTFKMENTIKYMSYNTNGVLMEETIKTEVIDLYNCQITPMLEFYNARQLRAGSQELAKLNNDLGILQKRLADTDEVCGYNNVIIFSHNGVANIGYIPVFDVQVDGVILPTDTRLPGFTTKLNLNSIKTFAPVKWVLDIKGYIGLIATLRNTLLEINGIMPGIDFTVNKKLLDGVFLSYGNNSTPYMSQSVQDYEHWALFSILAKEWRAIYYPIISKSLDSRLLRIETSTFDFYKCNSVTDYTVHVKPKFVKG